MKLNQSKQALVFNSEPIDLSALLSPALSRDPGACSSVLWDLGRAGASVSKVGKVEYIA